MDITKNRSSSYSLSNSVIAGATAAPAIAPAPKPYYLNQAFDDQNEPNISSILQIERKESEKSQDDDDEVHIERSSWDSPIEFLLSCISMSVGLGNIWRFPVTAYKNGGGAFLIPYLFVLVFIGRPIYFLEMSLGQFASYGSVKIWSLSPMFKGLGYLGMLCGTIIVSYYTSIIATTVYYFIFSCQKTLPWDECNPNWPNCTNCSVSNCPELYYNIDVTNQSPNIENGLGTPEWPLTLCLLFSWSFIFFSLVKGVQSSGKVAYFTAIFPYVVLFIFLIRGVTLEGAGTGIEYFITPQWDKILEPTVWYEAVGQCFFSLGTGTGTLTMFASYNPFKHTAYRDALIISLMDTFTSLLAGFTIFAVLGHLSVTTDTPMEQVAQAGPGLAFISYPSAISKFTWAPQLFAVLFFLMLFTLGIGSANALIGAVITIIQDQFPKVKKWYITFGACVFGFCVGLMYVTPGGQYMVTFMDYYGSGFILYFMCMVEVAAVSWFYGMNNYIRDLEFMLGMKIGWYWKISWGFIIPIGLFIILIYTFATAKALEHNNTLYPVIATAFGWGLAGFAVFLLPAFGLRAIMKAEGNSFWEKTKNAVYPAGKWGPRAPYYRKVEFPIRKLESKDQESAENTTSTYSIPLINNQTIEIKIRGIKERITVTPEPRRFLIRLAKLSSKSSTEYIPRKTGYEGWIQDFLGRTEHTWVVLEKEFEVFRVGVKSSRGLVRNVKKETSGAENNDLIITVEF